MHEPISAIHNDEIMAWPRHHYMPLVFDLDIVATSGLDVKAPEGPGPNKFFNVTA